ncbi:MAG TPA: hypothetical protein VG293_08725 [Solirubrobacteraceae bacterium]|nr:hypothetical protein [Solirubrobacteraceae bacterium]
MLVVGYLHLFTAAAPEVITGRCDAESLGGAAHVPLEDVRVHVDHRRDLRSRPLDASAAP